MHKLLGDSAIAHARRTSAQLYYLDKPVTLAEAVEQLPRDPAGVSCEQVPGYTCPRCGRTSHNPNDVRERYCGACHLFEGDAIP